MGLQPRSFVVTRLCPLMRLPTLVLAGPELRAELLRHRLARPENARPDRADRAIHDLRDLLVGETVELAQRDRRAQLLGEGRDGVVHRLRDLLGGELALG